MSIKLVGQQHRYEPKDTDEVRCEEHGIVTTWGRLSPIQRLCVEEGIDAKDHCLLSPEKIKE
jgi:hypothetical protein